MTALQAPNPAKEVLYSLIGCNPGVTDRLRKGHIPPHATSGF